MTKKVSIPLLIIVFLFSAFSITNFLSPKDIFSDAPVYTDDYSMHLSQCIATKHFLSSFGKCWAYDPFFLAGYPHGALVNADNKAWELLFFLFSQFFSEGFSFKLYLLIFLLLYPFILYGAAKNFSLSRGVALLASVLAILFFYLSITIEFVSWGMLSYVFMSYLGIYVVSLFYKLFEKFTWQRYLSATFFASLILLMHILSPFNLLFPIAILYILSFRRLLPSRHALIGLMAGVVLMLNSFWLLPVVKFFHYKTQRPDNYEFTLQIKNVFEPVNVYIRQHKDLNTNYRINPDLNNTFVEVALLLFGSLGFYSWWRKKKFPLLLSLLGGSSLLFIIAYYGSHTGFLPPLQPQRFIIPMNVFLIVPAAVGLGNILEYLYKGKSIPAVLFISCLVFVVLVGPVIRPLHFIFKNKFYRLNCEFPVPLKELLNWLENHTSPEGRILIEDSEFNSGHQFYGAHFPALFPEYVKREYLCAPRPMYPIKHSFASFTSGVLFEKNLSSYSYEELKQYLTLYNVKWIVCWSREAKDFFDKYPQTIEKLHNIDKFSIYQFSEKPSFFLKGSGTVQATYNRLQLNKVTAEDRVVILKYHWMKYLKTIPNRKIERVFLLNDPIGFIKIHNPPRSFMLINAY